MADYYVAPDGNNTYSGLSAVLAWQTLQYSVQQLRPSDTLHVAGGNYAGFALRPDLGCVSGTASGKISIISEDGAVINSAAALADPLATPTVIEISGIRYWDFTGIELQIPAGTTGFSFIVGSDSGNMNISDFVFSDGQIHLIAFDATFITVSDSEFYRSLGASIICHECTDVTVEDSFFEDAGNGAVGFVHDIGSGLTSNKRGIVRRCEFNRSKVYAVWSAVNAHDTRVENCFIHDSVLGATPIVIGADRAVLVNNTIVEGATSGITTQATADNTTIFNNLVISANGSTLPPIVNGGTNSQINTASQIIDNYANPAIESVLTNLFLDHVYGKNFRLRSASAARKIGVSSHNGKSAPANDLSGNLRPGDDTFIDAGAYEFTAGAITPTSGPTTEAEPGSQVTKVASMESAVTTASTPSSLATKNVVIESKTLQ